jgi:hypothetical protein
LEEDEQMFDEEAIRRRFAEASDEELYDILAHPNNYVSEALEAARDALRSRNLNPATAAALETSALQKTAEDSTAAARAKLQMKWVILVLVASFGIAFVRACVDAKQKSKASFLRESTESCTRVAVGKGMPEVTARPLCACRMQYFVDHHTASEVRQYSLNMNSPEAKKALTEAVGACQELLQ